METKLVSFGLFKFSVYFCHFMQRQDQVMLCPHLQSRPEMGIYIAVWSVPSVKSEMKITGIVL